MRAAVRTGALLLAVVALPLRASLPREWDFSRQDAKTQIFVSRGGAETMENIPPSSLGDFAPLRETASRSDLTASQPSSDPYGNVIAERGPAAGLCPFRHKTRYYDREDWLYYYGYRYYDPSVCKWISKDPLGESGGWNLTAFCDNDPVNKYDALGLDPLHNTQTNDLTQRSDV